MKILLIQPALKNKESVITTVFQKIWPLGPMTLNQLASITPKKHHVTCIDETFCNIDLTKKYDVVGITCNTPLAPRAYKIADTFRKNGTTVVLGGVHPSSLPHEAKQHADSVVIGEGEISWPKLIADLETKRKIKPFYQSKRVDPELIPPPDAKAKSGVNVNTRVQATRGCPNNCEFCSLHIIEGCTPRNRPIENVIKEIKSCKSKAITFVDNSLTINPAYTKSLFRRMIGLQKKFACFGNINVLAKDNELLELAYKAGCVAWEVGLESVSQRSLNGASKQSNKVSNYKKAIKNIKNHNMAVIGSFVFGFDEDTPDIFDKTWEAIQELELDSVTCNILTPYPGTRLYQRLEKEGRIITRDWSKYDLGHVVFEPKRMSKQELLHGTQKIVRRLYNPLNQLRMNMKSLELGWSPFIGTILRNYCNIDFYKKIYFTKSNHVSPHVKNRRKIPVKA